MQVLRSDSNHSLEITKLTSKFTSSATTRGQLIFCFTELELQDFV